MGTVSRVHTFASGAILTAAQLNNEFDNLLTSSAINGGLDATNLGVTAGQATASKALVVDASRNLADATGSNRINNLALSGTFESTGAVTASAGITSGGNIVSDTDSTDDLGTTGVRWANLFVDDVTVTNNVTIGGTLTLTGGITLNGNTTIGDSSADTLTVNSTITSNLIFTDATYDIGASGATRPRDLFLSRNAVMGGTLGVTGLITATGGVSGALTGNVTGDLSGNVTGGTISGTTATLTGGLTGTTGTFSGLISGNGGAEIGSNTAKVKFYSDSTYSGIYNGSSLTSDESYYFGSGDHFWYSDGSLAMKLDSSIVGIGTSSPSTYSFNNDAKLVVANTSANSTITIASGTSSSGYLAFADGTTGTDRYSGQVQYNHSTNTMSFKTGGGVEAMTINSAQDVAVDGDTLYIDASADRVGINTSSPAQLLEINGGSNPATIGLRDTSAQAHYMHIRKNGDQLQFVDTTNSGTTDRNIMMVIDSVNGTGNLVGIGTSSPTEVLDVTGAVKASAAANNWGYSASFFDRSGNDTRVVAGATSGNSSNIAFWTYNSGTQTEKARILSSGGITFNGDTSSNNALSDFEIGTWVPVLGRLTGSNYTFSRQDGFYTKIGNIVHVQFAITVSAVTTQGSRFFTISGLPFTTKNSTSQNGGGSATDQSGISGEPCTSIGVLPNDTRLVLFATGNPTLNGGLLGETGANTANAIAGNLVGAITYEVE